MKKKLYTVTDLGGGDGGKGGVVHKIASFKKAHTVIKVGGAQGSHGVRTASGLAHNFSQFGCGTFEGARTYVSELMVIEPIRFIEEGRDLSKLGINNPFGFVSIDENALVATPFHMLSSRINELCRLDKPKGTIGVGVGEAFVDSWINPDLAIRAKDLLSNNVLRTKLGRMKEQRMEEICAMKIFIADQLPEADKVIAKNLIDLFENEPIIDNTLSYYEGLARQVRIVDRDYLKNNVLKQDGTIVVESSHGVLTDRYYGFYPNVSRLRTVPEATINLIKSSGYDGEIVKLAVSRAYQIRHGAGPMVTENPDWLEMMLPGSSKDENRWQGKVRIGQLDLVSLKYAIDACGGPEFFDGIALTWFDQIQKIGRWDICESYAFPMENDILTPIEKISPTHLEEAEQIERQKDLTSRLLKSRPGRIKSYDISQSNRTEIINLASKTMENKLNIPLKMISFGPTERNKILL